MRTSQIIPVEELAKAALLFDAVGRWAQVDPFVLHGLLRGKQDEKQRVNQDEKVSPDA